MKILFFKLCLHIFYLIAYSNIGVETTTFTLLNKGVFMELKIFLVGILAGMVGGAIIVANSNKARKTIQDAQDKVVEKAEEIAETCKKQSKKHATNEVEE